MDASSTRREVLIGGGVALAHGAASLLRRISTSISPITIRRSLACRQRKNTEFTPDFRGGFNGTVIGLPGFLIGWSSPTSLRPY
jgi:hypothetical protein